MTTFVKEFSAVRCPRIREDSALLLYQIRQSNMAKTFSGQIVSRLLGVVATRSFKQVNGVQHCKAIVHQVAAIKICRVAGGGIGIDQQDIDCTGLMYTESEAVQVNRRHSDLTALINSLFQECACIPESEAAKGRC